MQLMLPLVFIFIPVLSFSEYFYLKRDNSASNCAPSWKGGGRGGWRELWVRTRSVGFAIRRVELSDLQSEYFKELHCLSIINTYTQCGRIANPPERNEICPSEKLCHSCNYSTIIFIKVNKNTIISLKMYLFANMTVFLLKNILFSQ